MVKYAVDEWEFYAPTLFVMAGPESPHGERSRQQEPCLPALQVQLQHEAGPVPARVPGPRSLATLHLRPVRQTVASKSRFTETFEQDSQVGLPASHQIDDGLIKTSKKKETRVRPGNACNIEVWTATRA